MSTLFDRCSPMALGRLLCRDESDRRRITEVGRALRPGVPFLIACFLIAGLSGIGSYGWWPLVPPAVALAVYAVTWLANMPRRARPEYAYATAFVFAELMLATAIVLGREARAPYLSLLVMPVLFVAVLFPRRAVFAAAGLGVALMVGVALTAGWRETAASPALAYTPVFVLASLVATMLVLRDLDDASRRSAFIDELTQALNRGALAPRLAELTHQASLAGSPVAVIVADIDHFKVINDEHGHVRGDAALRAVVRRLSDCVSAFEPVYRLGGEEFLILLPGFHAEAAQEVALAMWHAVRDSPIEGLRVTMSFGVAASFADAQFEFNELFTRADRALYAAKQGGRDWVRTAPGEHSAVQSAPTAETATRSPGAHDRPQGHVRPGIGAPSANVRSPGVTEPLGWTQASHIPGTQRTGGRRVTEDLEREYILDVNRRLSMLFRLIALGAFAVIAAGISHYGWHPLIAPACGAIPYALLSRHADRFRRPSLALNAGWALFQGSIAIGFTMASGSPLFALPLIVLMVPGRCGVLKPRLAIAATLYTAALMTTAALVLDSHAVLGNPSLLLFPLALLAEAAYVGAIVGRSALGHRGAGIVDELTGLLNRTALSARVLELAAQPSTAPDRVGMLLIDIDHFKSVNDRMGHAAGDLVLREVGARIRASLRTYEFAYRLGGEEVLVLLPHASADAATEVAERLRQAIGAEPCGGVPVTVSVGVGVTAPGEHFLYEEVFQRADAALYRAKREGRDRVSTQTGPDRDLGAELGLAAPDVGIGPERSSWEPTVRRRPKDRALR